MVSIKKYVLPCVMYLWAFCLHHNELLSQGNSEKENPLNFLEAVIGDWYMYDEESLGSNPEATNSIGFRFQWADNRKKVMHFYEGVRAGDIEQAILSCQIAANPSNGIVQFQGYQALNDFYYYGRYEPLQDGQGFVRIFDVYYPAGTKFMNEADRKKQMKTYRTVCRLTSRDSITCKVEQLDFGFWQAYGNGKPWHLVRRTNSWKAEKVEELQLSKLKDLTGNWVSSIDEKYRNHPMIQKFNPALKPQLMEVKWSLDHSLLHLTIYNIDRPENGDTTLFVKGFILPNSFNSTVKMMEYNMDSDITHHGNYRLDEEANIIRQFEDSGNPKRKFKEYWKWTDDKKQRFEWYTYSYINGEYHKGDVVVTWEKFN